MSGEIGLRPREMRVLWASWRATLLSTLFAVSFAGPVVGPHWILLAGAAGAVLAWAAFRADGTCLARGAPDSHIRRSLGRVCEWGSFAGLAMSCAVFWVVLEFHLSVPGLIARLEALPDGPMTKGAFFAAMAEVLCETWRQALENAELPITLVGVFGIANVLLSGLAHGLLVGAVSARCGVSLWRALYAGAGGGKDWQAFARRERAGRRRLLRGEA